MAVVCLGTLVAPLDSSVNISLPSISHAFGRGIEDIRWIVIAYVLTYSCLLMICGKLGDLYGYRRVFQLGLITATAGFACCALAPTFTLLLLGRVLQGLGIALTLSCAPALATTLYDEAERTRVIGIYAAMTAVGAALGPVVGGALIEIFGWRVVFWMRAPIALAALIFSWTIPVRPYLQPATGFDLAGAGLLILWLVTLLLALALRTEMAGIEVRLLLLAVAAVAFVVFLRHEARHPEPIIRPALFRDAGFTLVNVVSVIVNYAAFSILLLVPYYLVRTAGLAPGPGGLVLALAAIGTVAGSWLAGRIASRITTAKLVVAGLALSLAGLTGIAQWSEATGLSVIALALIVQGLGVGLFNVAYTDLVTATLPLRDRGVAGSLTMVTRTIGVVAGATLHAQIQRVNETAAQLAGATAEQAFVAGFQAAFWAAALVLAGGLALCLLAHSKPSRH
ncbi:MAG: MFS transporter [Hyphomicrobiaceae bacterium]